MTKIRLLEKIIPVTILFITIYSIISLPAPGINFITNLQNTTIWWIIILLILMIFFLSKKYFFDRKNSNNMLVVLVYMSWNIICIFRGMFVAEGYWIWKGLIGNSLALLLPIVVYTATNKHVLQSILSFYVKRVLPFFILFIFLISTDAYGFYLIPISFFLLFAPALTLRWKIVILIITALVLLIDLSARSNVIKFIVPVLLLPIYYFRKILPVKMLSVLQIFLIFLPIIFFMLATSNLFNVFDMDNYIKGDYYTTVKDETGKNSQINVKADTRSELYEEVLSSAVVNKYWILGRTPARGNDSDIFGSDEKVLTGKSERLANEVAILNIFTWTGLIGIILYLIVFFRASYLAVNKSKNIYIKILGIYVAFRWSYAWVEDINNFSLNYFMLWIMLGICFSFSFRSMNNKEITLWVRGIFDFKYRNFENLLIQKKNNKCEKNSYSNYLS